jgi:hypothetical protein
MLSSVINPEINYDEANWAITLVWDDKRNRKIIIIEGETSFQSLFVTLEYKDINDELRIRLTQTCLNKDDAKGRQDLFFYREIDELKPSCKTFLRDKQTTLELIRKYTKGSSRETVPSYTSLRATEYIFTNISPEDYLTENQWINSALSPLGIEIPEEYKAFRKLEGITNHVGTVAAMSGVCCSIL